MRRLRDLLWILPSALVLGLVLALFSPGTWWIGWLAYTLLLALGLSAIIALWRSAGSPRSLVVMLFLTLVLRLGVGLFFSSVLPLYGNNTEVHQAGFIYRDAFTYDSQSWDLASSGDPLWKAFDRSYGIEEQYGGLTFFESLLYRSLSPDAHRPWLTILFSALAGAIGVAFAWKGSHQAWETNMANVVGWVVALYPESLLTGASQVREPFLILFIAMAFWGVVSWRERRRLAIIWLVSAALGLLLFSPGVAAAAIVILSVWVLLRGKERRIRWWWVAGTALVIVLVILLFAYLVSSTLQVPTGPIANLINWLRYSANYGAYMTTLSSGWLQTIFAVLPKFLQMPFIVAYGVAQPVLPAAIADPAVWPVRLLSILRGLGWYALLPFLLYSLYAILKAERKERLAWVWLWLAVWFWIALASFRAGGDQWDNPRYRLILLLFQAAVGGYSLLWAIRSHDRWLGRLLAMEGVFLALFGYWYFSRYSNTDLRVINVFIVFAAIAVVSLGILIGGWIWDRRQGKRRQKEI